MASNRDLINEIKRLNIDFDKRHDRIEEMASIRSLNKKLFLFIKRYKRKIEVIQKKYISSDRTIEIRKGDFVACSIAAKFNKHGSYGTSHILLSEAKCHKRIFSLLRSIGGLGRKSSSSDNIIGKCAEIKAAHQLLKVEKIPKISSIEFTTAIRPRTLEKVPRCSNCTQIFGYERV